MATLVHDELILIASAFLECLQIENELILTSLKYMDLRCSSSITSSPDVSGIPYLEYLNLSKCDSMVEVHQSVMLHERIIHLDLSSCSSLRILPHSIQMKSLQMLNLYACESLGRFPEISMETRRLLVLEMDRCQGIRGLPSSFRLLTSLTILTVGQDHNEEFDYSRGVYKRCLQVLTHLRSLRVLDLRENNFVEEDFPMDLQNAWPCLEELNLYGNLMTRLPASISHLSHLKYLNLRKCENLKELPELPEFIQVLKADGCGSLQKIGDISNKYNWLFQISFKNCGMLLQDQETQIFLDNMLMKSFVHKCAAMNHRLSIAVPGRKIPNWFTNKCLGNTITMELDQSQITKMTGLAICCIIAPFSGTYKFPKLFIKFKPSSSGKLIDLPPRGAEGSHVWIGYMSTDILGNIPHGFEPNGLILEFHEFCSIMECGVCVIHKDDTKSLTGTGSWIPDYDDMEMVDRFSASGKGLPNGRWSCPTFSIEHETTGHIGKVEVSGLNF
ncbi:TMV resistance protein N-like [Helianthus annuus]|uniref:TMV resistance protein N-like n=1 Tax=Helianthus annuus TaxID=4232 RepID=UPI001652BAE9|nr:TMV resistance protein N-like [Helianthus annuus]